MSSCGALFAVFGDVEGTCFFEVCDPVEYSHLRTSAIMLISMEAIYGTYKRRSQRHPQKGSGKFSEKLRESGRQAHPRSSEKASNKKLLGTSASLLVTSALLVVTRSY